MADDFDTVRVAGESETTGALVVVFHRDCPADTAARRIETVIGRQPARSGRHKGRAQELVQELDQHGATLFDDFGIAVLDPRLCNVSADAIRSSASCNYSR